jgi:hypothetical protein
MKTTQFHDVIAKLLGERLKHFNNSKKTLDIVACVEIYQTIFDSLVEVFKTSNVTLTNEAMNYLAQQYYDGVLINGRQELNPNIFTTRAKLENIETKECALLAVMLNGTDFAIPILQEIKKRA